MKLFKRRAPTTIELRREMDEARAELGKAWHNLDAAVYYWLFSLESPRDDNDAVLIRCAAQSAAGRSLLFTIESIERDFREDLARMRTIDQRMKARAT